MLLNNARTQCRFMQLHLLHYLCFMNTIYSPKEAADLLNIPLRTVQYRCKKQGIRKKNNIYQITEQHIDDWLEDTQTNANNVTTITQEFTQEEYNQLEEIIKQNPINLNDIKHLQEMIESYQEQIQYLRNSLDKKDDMMNRLIVSLDNHTKNLLQKNYIEAKDKNYDE